MNEDIEKVKNWQKDSYHRQMIGGFKETKEAEEGFKKAQKPWAKKLKEVQIKDFNDVNSVLTYLNGIISLICIYIMHMNKLNAYYICMQSEIQLMYYAYKMFIAMVLKHGLSLFTHAFQPHMIFSLVWKKSDSFV